MKTPNRPNAAPPAEICFLRIEDALDGGRWLACLPDGMALFLSGDGIPGETVRAVIDQRRKRFAEGRILEVMEPSPDRVEAPCPWFSDCGGCSWQHVRPEAERRAKYRHLADSMERIGHFLKLEPAPMLASPEAYGYRNRVELSAGSDRKGRLKLGMHGRGPGHPLVPVDACLLAGEGLARGYRELAAALRAAGIRAWDARRKDGLLRSVILRCSAATGDRMVIFVTRKGSQGSRLLKASGVLDPDDSGSWSVIQSVVPGKHDHGPAVEIKVLAGKSFLEDRIGPYRLQVPADAFLQVHRDMSSELYEEALRQADPGPDDRVWEAYSGIGALSLFLASRAGVVEAREGQSRAVEAARVNAALNGVGGIDFGVMDFNDPQAFLSQTPDLVVVDPPRSGLSPALAETLAVTRARRIVYVSCNPASLARDAAVLCDGGRFRLSQVRPVDMFPRTGHLESVASFDRS